MVLLIISETVDGSLIGNDGSLIGGLISAVTLVVIAQMVGYITWKSKTAERFFEGMINSRAAWSREQQDLG